MTLQEQIAALEAARAAKQARMQAIMQKTIDEGRTTDEAESEEFDTLEAEVRTADEDLRRLRSLEKLSVASATPITPKAGATADKASAARGAIISVQRNLPKGTAFVRYAMALAASRGSRLEAVEYARRWEDTTPEVSTVLRAAVAAGTTTDADWAAPLVEYQNMAGEFVELLRPMTIIGRIDGLRRVPFNVKMPTQTQGSSVGWVGQGLPKPVSELKFGQISLGMAKAAGIVVLSEELVRSSSPAAEALVSEDLRKEMAKFLDAQFVDPLVAESANVSPASITNGITPVPASGTTAAHLRADVESLFGQFIAAHLSPTSGVWIMSNAMALSISLMRNALDQPEFQGINLNGGTFFGLPVITSQSVVTDTGGTDIILANASDILLADDGGVNLDVSREASLQMDSAPSTGAQALVSLWQNNLVGLRAERYINWKRRRTEAVGFINNAKYSA